MFLCIGHDGAWARDADRGYWHRGPVDHWQDARLNRVDIADVHSVRNECTPTFYERFEDPFLCEERDFVQAVLEDRAPAVTLHDAAEATRIAIALRRSLEEHRAVDL